MRDGEHTIYAVQCRRTHESKWLKPDGPLRKAAPDTWCFASFDHFGFAWEPNLESRSHEQIHNVWHATDHHGYTTMAYAMKALRRLHEASEAGKFDAKDGYGKRHQALRHEFRLVKLEMRQKTTVVNLSEVMEAL